jgi:hypothetical protein
VDCQHAEGAEITAVCCLTRTDDTKNVVITATTTRGIHSLHIWHIEYQQTEAVEELISTVAMAHSNAIISICAVPAGTLRSRGVACAFVTCSKGNGG